MSEKKGLFNYFQNNPHTAVEYDNGKNSVTPTVFEITNKQTKEVLCSIKFQDGPIRENGVNGVQNEDLIAVVIERLKAFQKGPFGCKQNEYAIIKLTECLMWLKDRTVDRICRNVEGQSKE